MKRRICGIAFTAVLFLGLPLHAQAARLLVPVGEVIGLQLRHDKVTVVGFEENTGAKDAGLRVGDEIVSIEGRPVESPEDIRSALPGCGHTAGVTVRREGKELALELPVRQTEAGKKLGVSLRQGVAGIGTVTWYDPESKAFGTLGHGVSTGKNTLLVMESGSAYDARVLSVVRGKCGDPGQLKGEAGTVCGQLLRNTPQGVFGISSGGWQGEPVPVAAYEEIVPGPASIRATVRGEDTREYSVEILKIYPREKGNGRNFLLKVTDPALLEATGGIVQGMSGSPIIQDGKLVGAVTHVLVNDPTRGYGIFIENMLDAAS